MVKVGLIGAGKMGISHLAILGAHPNVQVVGVCDSTKMVIEVLNKYTSFPCYTDYEEMIRHQNPDAVFVAVPTKLHASMVKQILKGKRHVFVEKPLCLTAEEAKELVDLAKQNNVINQVGYHNKFVGTFQEVKRLLDLSAIGELLHFTGEAYGPVVIRPPKENWRANPSEGGGCLMDYASHVIDLVNFLLGPISEVKSSILKSFYSKKVEDSVFSLVQTEKNISGVLSVNWSDETYRKMSTSISIIGSKGKIICDANELKVHFKLTECPYGYRKGWNIKYITDLTEPVDFYLRGEEYSAQIDYFIDAIQKRVPNNVNTFETAWHTDKVISLIRKSSKN